MDGDQHCHLKLQEFLLGRVPDHFLRHRHLHQALDQTDILSKLAPGDHQAMLSWQTNIVDINTWLSGCRFAVHSGILLYGKNTTELLSSLSPSCQFSRQTTIWSLIAQKLR
jgi:hypothetical protein